LYDGDVVVVRKSDGIWQRWTREKDESGWAAEREKVLAYEKQHCRSSSFTGWLRIPPVPVRNNIVVYKDPETYPPKWNIKRVIGLGGQIVFTPMKRDQWNTTGKKTAKSYSMDEYMAGMRVATPCVPPYSIWVEGDNPTHSRDSRHQNHGPVSKKLLVGVAEYRVWPPWRIGKLDRNSDALDAIGSDFNKPQKHSRPRSYWPGRL
jgi:signal peptidase I